MTTITQPDPDGVGPLAAPVWGYTFDARGLLASETDPLGNVTSHQYDAAGRATITAYPDPDGTGPLTSPQTAIAYDLAGQPTSQTDALGRLTGFSFDTLGRLATVTLPDPDDLGPLTSPVLTRQYDIAGNLLTETDPLGNATHYSLDAQNRVTEVTGPDPDGSGPLAAPVTSFAFDLAGQLASTTDPLGRTTSFTFNTLGQLTERTLPDPDGIGLETSPFTQFQYDAVGNLTGTTDALNRQTSYAYNSLNWRTGITDAAGGTTTLGYDDNGNQTSLTDPEDNTTSWVYDTLNRVILDTNELNDSRSFAYDANSNLTTRTDRNGRVIEFEYDHLNQMNEESWYVGGVLQETRDFRYDAMGNLTSVNSDEAVYAFAYDNLDRRTQTIRDYLTLTSMPSVTTSSVYDSNNRRTQLAATIGSTDDFVTDFAYDSLSRMTGIEQHGVTGGNAVADKRIDLAYNAAGQFDTISRYANLAGTQSVATTDFLYDNTGRLSDLTHAQNATTLSGYSYSYDAASQLAEIDSLIDGVTTYTQDITGQLTAADHVSQADESYAYDDNGNRTGSGTSTGDDNQLLSDGTYNYEYDPEGNRIKKTNIATGAATDYTWDWHNNLIEVIEKNSSGMTLKAVQYGYDGFDHKIWKKVITSSGTQTEVYVYDGLRQEQSGTGDVMILRFDGSGDVTNRYLHGPDVDQVLADEQVSSTTTPGDIFWPLTDHLGSVRDVAEYDAVTGITSIANHIVYDSFGNRTSETNAAIDSLFGFTGREWDDDVDLQYNRARWYDPATGRWLSNDPIGFAAGDANLYRYVGNQPTTLTDPSGLDWLDSSSDFFAGCADTITFGATDDIRDWAGVNDGVDHSGTAYGAGGAAATGVAVGAGGAFVITAGAPILVSGGASILTVAGVPVATSTAVSTATVTVGVFATGIAGAINTGVSTTQAVQEGDWEQVAYNAGVLTGGFVVCTSGGGRYISENMMGHPSAAPNTWNPLQILKYEWEMRYIPGEGLPGLNYWATSPTPFSGGLTATTSPGMTSQADY